MSIIATAAMISASADDGLVASYSCDGGQGTVLSDRGGRDNDGQIVGGVRWVKGPFGAALQFDGQSGYVDCGDALDISRGGTLLVWFRPEQVCQGGLLGWSKGANTLDQRLVVSLNTFSEPRIDGDPVTRELGLYISDGEASDKPFRSNYHRPFFPQPDEWLCYGVTFDGRTVNIYRDGVLEETRFQTLSPDVRGLPLWIGRCNGTGGPSDFFRGLMSQVRVYNRPLSQQEVHQFYMATAAGREKDTSGFGSIRIRPQLCPEAGIVFADLDCLGLAPLKAAPRLSAQLLGARGKVVAPGRIHMLPVWGRAEVRFDAAKLPQGSYTIRVGGDAGKPATAKVQWPGRAPGWEKIKVLNNFCWELLNEKPGGQPATGYTFTTPRQGWVYFDTEGRGDLTLSVPGASPEVVRTPNRGQRQQVMRWLAAGEHSIAVGGNGTLDRLTARSVPILLFVHYPHVGPGTGNDSDFLAKHVLAPYNTLHTHNYGPEYNPGEFRQKWASELGRQSLEGIYPAPLLQPYLKDETAAQQIRDFVAKAPGMHQPEFRGVMLDEFAPGDDCEMWYPSYYDEWTQECAKLLEDPQYAGHLIVPFHGYNMFDFRKSTDFLRMFIARGSYAANEWYFDERDTEEQAWIYLNESLAALADRWASAIPGCMAGTIATLSYLQRENWNPAVNFRVHLDMQFEHFATRPEFFGLGGIGAYSSYNCNSEEAVRCVAQLCRHYGLEGQTSRLDDEPYLSGLVQNPDFEHEAEGWQLSPAEAGSMGAKSLKGYGALAERYPYRAWTETGALWMRRSAAGPNTCAQTLRNLRPGQLYSVRVWVGDYSQWLKGASVDEDRAVTLRVEGADAWDEWYRTALFKGNVYTFQSYLCPPFNGDNRYVFKVRQLIFRARKSTARLVISDWAGDTEPGGPIGQELLFNGVYVHPYLPYTEEPLQ